MADMIKFYKGLEKNLPAAGTSGALYVTTDEGAIYIGTGTGMKRLGDFCIVAEIANLPAKAHTNCLYYCEKENVLCKYTTGTGWVQINKQPTTEELKQALGLGDLAYKSIVAESDLSVELKAKVDASAEGNHSHANKAELDKIATGDKAKWDAAEQNAKTYADGLNKAMDTRMTAVEGSITTLTGADTVDGSVKKALKDAKAYTDQEVATAKEALVGTAEDTDASDTVKGAKKYADKLNTAMGTRMDAVETALGDGGSVATKITAAINALDVADTVVAGQYVSAVSEEDGKIKVSRASLPDYTDTYDAKGAAAAVQKKLDEEVTRAGNAEGALQTAVEAAQTAADNAQSDVNALKGKVGTVPEDKTVVEMISDAQKAATYDDTAIKASIKQNTDAIGVLNGGETTDGSVAKAVKDAINDFATKTSDDETVNTFKELVDYAASHSSEYSELAGEVQKNTTAIATLNGDATKAGSVAKAIKDAINAENLSQYAKGADLTTLTTRVSTAEGKITTAESDIDALESDVAALKKVGSQANVIETVKVNGTALTPDAKKAVDVIVPTGALANKDKVAEADLEAALATKINGKAETTALNELSNKVGTIPAAAGVDTVVAYVDKKVADEGVAALKTRVSTAEGKIDALQASVETITGDEKTAGSIKKAAADTLASAKSYTDELANGAVKTNTDDIATLKTGKADNATTLAGYGIADAYTKEQVAELLTWGEF